MVELKPWTIYLEPELVKEANILLLKHGEEINKFKNSRSGLLNYLLKKWVGEMEKEYGKS